MKKTSERFASDPWFVDVESFLLIDELWGIHIPEEFWKKFSIVAWGLDATQAYPISDVEHPHYWEAWDYVLKNARHLDPQGIAWVLHQDGDLFAVAEGGIHA